jgi:zinc/manganese transport system substrate-binding protein
VGRAACAGAWRTALLAGALLAAIATGPARAAEPPLHVIATVGDLGAIAREVLGPGGEVVVLTKPTQDPHFVDPRPHLVLDLERADALLSMGLDYEVGWLPALVKGSRNPRIQPGAPGAIVASTMVALEEAPPVKPERSMRDLDLVGNPHFTLDPRNGARIARGLAVHLGELSPEHRALYRKNAEAFAGRLDARTRQWEQRMAPWRGTSIVTFHRTFTYLFAWLGLVEGGTVEPKPGRPPNGGHVAELVQQMKAHHVPVILQERWYPSSVAERIASQTGAKLVLIAGMTPENVSYADHLDEIIRALEAALPPTDGKPQ